MYVIYIAGEWNNLKHNNICNKHQQKVDAIDSIIISLQL